MTLPMEDVLAGVTEGRAHLKHALDALSVRRDSPKETEELREVVGRLAAIIGRWERERARWQA